MRPRPTLLYVGVCSGIASLAVSTFAWAEQSEPAATTATTATAETSPTPEIKQKAMGHFETGLRLYEDGDFSLALIEFERAYSYIPDYRVLYNIGQVSIQLGRYARASLALQQYLTQGGASIPAARISAVREDLKMLEGRTAHLQVVTNVDEVEVLLDDLPIGVTPMVAPTLVDAGEHRLTLRKSGYITRTERLVLAGRDENKLQVDLDEVPKVSAAPLHPAIPQPQTIRQQPESTPSGQPMSARTQWLYVGAGATGLFAIGWAITGYLGIKAAGELHDTLQGPTTEGKLDSLRSNARSALLASDILGVATLATGATTLFFTLKGPSTAPAKDEKKAQASTGISHVRLGMAPSAIQVTGSFF